MKYIGTDIVGSALYPGYSFAAQAPSELFAIGAPTSRFVVTAFSLSSLLLLAFAFGVWRHAHRSSRRECRGVACPAGPGDVDPYGEGRPVAHLRSPGTAC
jgi:hypothetical protein